MSPEVSDVAALSKPSVLSELSGHDWTAPSGLDRVGHDRRSPEWVARQWRSEGARLLVLDADTDLAVTDDRRRLRMTGTDGDYDAQRHRLLGLVDDRPVFAVQVGAAAGPMAGFREIGGELSEAERDIAAAAIAMTRWHQLEPLCPRCGGPTSVTNGGYARHCERCAEEHFPRTDPAVIVAIVDDDDRLLLGRQASWGMRVSVLAGFVETGESLEQTIHREVAEEVDITLDRLRYVGSQPWPFPRSLMTGFFAHASTTTIRVDAEEIAWAGWFTRDELTRRLDAGEIGLPGASSIAHRLISTWRSEPTVW